MTDKRISPLQWLSTKFASLNHSHSEYLTSHQDITGKEDKTNKSSSISTDTGSTTKYPTVKAIEDYIDDFNSYIIESFATKNSLNSKESTSNKSSSITTDTGSTTKYPTVKAVEDYAQPKGNYLTQHQSLKTVNNESLVGTGNITIDTGSDIDIVTDWEQTLSDEKVASEKLVKESIDSVLYITENLTLRTPTTSSNIEYSYEDKYGDSQTLTINTLNSSNIPYPSNENIDASNEYPQYVIDVTFPNDSEAIFIFGDSFTLFCDGSGVYNGVINYPNQITENSNNRYWNGNSIKLIFQQISQYGYTAFLNDRMDTFTYCNMDERLIRYSSNVSINNIEIRVGNISNKLSRFVDDISKAELLKDGADLDYLLFNKTYYGYTGASYSNCPVQNKRFVLWNKDITGESSTTEIQQVLMTINDGANTEFWVRYHNITGGYSGTWVKLANTNDIDSLMSSIESLKKITSKYFKQEDFLNPDCWYTDWDNHSYKPTYSDGTLSFNNRSWYLFNFDKNYVLPDDYTMEILYSIVGSPMLLINGTTIPLSSNSNRIYIYTNGGNTYVEYDSESTQTITGKMETFQVRVTNTTSSFEITDFTVDYSYPSNNLWDKKQDVLVSGTNLKTINNESLLGSGNISITSGSGGNVTVDSSWISNSTNPVESQLIKTALDNKEQTSNKVTSISSSSTDNQYPSAKCVYDEMDSLWDNIPNTNDFELVIRKVNDLSLYTSDTDMYPSTKAVADYIDNVLPTNLSDLIDDINCVTTSSASSTTPSSDISGGSSGSSTNYARADHQHQLSDAYARSSHTHSAYVNPTIADNLTTNDSSQVLSAKQGKILNDLIGQAITYINQ